MSTFIDDQIAITFFYLPASFLARYDHGPFACASIGNESFMHEGSRVLDGGQPLDKPVVSEGIGVIWNELGARKILREELERR